MSGNLSGFGVAPPFVKTDTSICSNLFNRSGLWVMFDSIEVSGLGGFVFFAIYGRYMRDLHVLITGGRDGVGSWALGTCGARARV